MAKVRDLLTQRFGFLRGNAPSMQRGESMALLPVRHPGVTWEPLSTAEAEEADEVDEFSGGVMLLIPRRTDRMSQIVARLLRVHGSHRKLELDAMGAAIWTRCDGSHTVEDLVRILSDTYKMNRRQCEVSVITFMRMLSQRRLVLFASPRGAEPNVASKSRRARKQRRRA
jgi:hypothetical protein